MSLFILQTGQNFGEATEYALSIQNLLQQVCINKILLFSLSTPSFFLFFSSFLPLHLTLHSFFSLSLFFSILSQTLSHSLSIFWQWVEGLWIGSCDLSGVGLPWVFSPFATDCCGVLAVGLSWVCLPFACRGFAMGVLVVDLGCAHGGGDCELLFFFFFEC